MIRVFLADDHVFVRQAIRRLLSDAPDIRVVAEAGDGETTLSDLQKAPCDVCLLDLSMPGQSGLELLRQVHHAYPELPVLVLSMHNEQQYAVRCIRAGARGYLCKNSSTDEVLQGIRLVARGEMVLNPALTQELALTMLTEDKRDPHTRLSDRELEVFGRLVSGHGVTRIAEELALSVKTISTHKTRIQKKLACDGIAALVRYAQMHDLLDHQTEKQ